MMLSFQQRVRRSQALGDQLPDGVTQSMKETFDAVTKTFLENARPILREDVLPALQADKELQRTVGLAVGEAMGKTLVPWVVGGFAAIVLAMVFTRKSGDTNES